MTYSAKFTQLVQMIEARTTLEVVRTIQDTLTQDTREAKVIQNAALGVYRKRMEAKAAERTDAMLMDTIRRTVGVEECGQGNPMVAIMGITSSNELERRHPDVVETLLDWEVAWDQEHGPMELEWTAYLFILMAGVQQKSA